MGEDLQPCPFVGCHKPMTGDELMDHIRAEHSGFRKLVTGTLDADEIEPVADLEGSA